MTSNKPRTLHEAYDGMLTGICGREGTGHAGYLAPSEKRMNSIISQRSSASCKNFNILLSWGLDHLVRGSGWSPKSILYLGFGNTGLTNPQRNPECR